MQVETASAPLAAVLVDCDSRPARSSVPTESRNARLVRESTLTLPPWTVERLHEPVAQLFRFPDASLALEQCSERLSLCHAKVLQKRLPGDDERAGHFVRAVSLRSLRPGGSGRQMSSTTGSESTNSGVAICNSAERERHTTR